MHDVCRWRDCRNQTFGEDEITIISEPASDSEIFIVFLGSFIYIPYLCGK